MASETKKIDQRQRGILKGILEQKTGESEENSRKDYKLMTLLCSH